MRTAFVQKLSELAESDPRILLIVGDIGFGVFEAFAQRFPKQFLNAGIAEQNMIGVAAGLAMEGRVVFVFSIGNFPTLRCFEQIRNDICYHDANVKIVGMGGGVSYGVLGMSHHATEDLGLLRALPGMTVVAPGDDWETSQATELLAKTDGPFYLRLDRSPINLGQKTNETFRLGKARRLREGSDITLVATGNTLERTINAADVLAVQNIQCRVLSMHTLKPLDLDAVIDATKDTNGIITIEEHSVIGGLGSAVSEACLTNGAVPKVFRQIALRDEFASVGSPDHLRERYQIDANSIVVTVQKYLRDQC